MFWTPRVNFLTQILVRVVFFVFLEKINKLYYPRKIDCWITRFVWLAVFLGFSGLVFAILHFYFCTAPASSKLRKYRFLETESSFPHLWVTSKCVFVCNYVIWTPRKKVPWQAVIKTDCQRWESHLVTKDFLIYIFFTVPRNEFIVSKNSAHEIVLLWFIEFRGFLGVRHKLYSFARK